MEANILRDLFCFQCSYQFGKRSIYDKHQLLIHNYTEKKGFQEEIKIEDEEIDSYSESNLISNNYTDNHSSEVSCSQSGT